jgi:hypothetical protein
VQQLESGAEDVLKAHIVELFEATRRMTEPGRAGKGGQIEPSDPGERERAAADMTRQFRA